MLMMMMVVHTCSSYRLQVMVHVSFRVVRVRLRAVHLHINLHRCDYQLHNERTLKPYMHTKHYHTSVYHIVVKTEIFVVYSPLNLGLLRTTTSWVTSKTSEG